MRKRVCRQPNQNKGCKKQGEAPPFKKLNAILYMASISEGNVLILVKYGFVKKVAHVFIQ